MQSRVSSLDGLRGLAALMVVLGHSSGALGWFSSLPGLFNGVLAVNIFFILSGYVLSLSLLDPDSKGLRQKAGRFPAVAYALQRLIRLWLPYAVVLVAAFTFRNSFNPVSCGSENIISDAYCKRWLDPFVGASFFDQLKGLYSPHLVAPSWTLPVELANSLLVPICILVFRSSPIYLGLLAGISIADLFISQTLPQAFYMFALGSAAALVPGFTRRTIWAAPILLLSYCVFVLPVPFEATAPLLLTPAALAAVHLSLSSQRVSRFLSSPLLTGLGAISFSMYLLHWPLLLGGAPKIAHIVQGISLSQEVFDLKIVSFLVYLIALIVLSVIFHWSIDSWSISIGRWFKRRLSF